MPAAEADVSIWMEVLKEPPPQKPAIPIHPLLHHQYSQRLTGRAPKSFYPRPPPGDPAPRILPLNPLSRLAKLRKGFGTTITLNGSAPLRSVLRRSLEWVGMEQAMSSEENSKKRMIPWVEAGAKVRRLHARWGSQNSADMTPELPSDLGSSRRKNWGLALPTPNFAGEW